MQNLNTYRDAATAVNQDLRTYMLKVFSYMAGGVALTAFIAYLVLLSPLKYLLFNPVAIIGIAIAQFVIAIYFSRKLPMMSLAKAQTIFWSYVILEGLTISIFGVIYTGSSIITAFFITSSMFLSMVIYGYTTKKDISSWGAILFMGVIGILIASFVNLFLNNGQFSLILSIITVVVFTALVAYDTQMIKNLYYEYDSDSLEKIAVLGAFRLYLDFIILFINILKILNNRR